ncbi:MAG TPA: hypothetical protein VF692_10185 [Pyrinomonadaceae bacterium]|jgi:hypothetical protein
MTDSEEIQYSVADAVDMEKLRDAAIPVARFFRSIEQYSAQVVTHYRGKVARLRASFYFSVL